MRDGDPYETEELDGQRARQRRWLDAMPGEWKSEAWKFRHGASPGRSDEPLPGAGVEAEVALRRSADRELTEADRALLEIWESRQEAKIVDRALTHRVGMIAGREDLFEAYRGEVRAVATQNTNDYALTDTMLRAVVLMHLAEEEAPGPSRSVWRRRASDRRPEEPSPGGGGSDSQRET